jgi:hypothetical protein
MPRIVTSIHDPIALAATCRRLGLPSPVESTIQLGAEEVSGWVVHLPQVRHPVVCDIVTGLVAYHPEDNTFHRYACIMKYILRYYDIRAKLRQESPGRVRQRTRRVATERNCRSA